MTTVKVSSSSLVSILESIKPQISCFSIMYITAISKQDSGVNIPELEEKAESIFGFQISREKLLSLYKKLERMDECVIVGCRSMQKLPARKLPLDDLKPKCEVLVETLNGRDWEVSVKDINILDNLRST